MSFSRNSIVLVRVSQELRKPVYGTAQRPKLSVGYYWFSERLSYLSIHPLDKEVSYLSLTHWERGSSINHGLNTVTLLSITHVLKKVGRLSIGHALNKIFSHLSPKYWTTLVFYLSHVLKKVGRLSIVHALNKISLLSIGHARNKIFSYLSAKHWTKLVFYLSLTNWTRLLFYLSFTTKWNNPISLPQMALPLLMNLRLTSGQTTGMHFHEADDLRQMRVCAKTMGVGDINGKNNSIRFWNWFREM